MSALRPPAIVGLCGLLAMLARAGASGRDQPIPTDPLASWNDTAPKKAILAFVAKVSKEGSPDFVPPSERVAVFDNDGTLWCERPMPIQLDFILRRLVAMADQDPTLRTRQPWQAAYDKDYQWFGQVLARHYQGDDRDLPALAAGVLQAFGGITVEEFEARPMGSCAAPSIPPWAAGIWPAPMCRWWNCWDIWRRTGSPTTSPRGVGVTLCGRSARRSTACLVSG